MLLDLRAERSRRHGRHHQLPQSRRRPPTPDGIAPEIRDASRAGRIARLVEPEAMVQPLLWLVSSAADAVNGYRFDANRWDAGLPPEHAARRSGGRAGLVLHAEDEAG